jgi:photosystem II stability/assembly factor-like uncharacterized protein
MKKLLLLLILHSTMYIVNCFSQQYGWIDISENIPPFPYDTTIINNGQDTIIASLTDVYFVDDDEGWVTTYHPFHDTAAIIHTTDGGETFEVQTTILPCNAIWMRNGQEGYAGGQSGLIYKTTNGGQNWNFHGTIVNTVMGISFPVTVDTGTVSGLWGSIWGITQTGVFNFNCGLASSFLGTSTTSSNHSWTCGSSSIYFVDGSGCSELPSPTGTFNKIQFINDQLGWVAGESGGVDTGLVAGSPDGINWVVLGYPPASMSGLFALDSNNVWAIGKTTNREGIIMLTTNGSDFGFDTTTSTGWSNVVWNQEAAGLSTDILAGVYFTSPTNGYVVGNNKTLLKYTRLTSLEDEREQPTEFKLEQNYPNPFNPSTSIQYAIGSRQFVQLKVYDVLGKEIATLVNDEKSAGSYEVEFNPVSSIKDLTSGVYFYQLKAGNYLETKKMILMK